MEDTWTIVQLAELAAEALRVETRPAAPPVSGRVREVPGERQIRWYTTIGLLDPPLTRRGRVARYGHRHLLQLVAVKRLQAAGHSLAAIQSHLTGATDTTLEQTAQIPAAPSSSTPATPSGAMPAAPLESTGTGPDRPRFWARPNPAETPLP